MGSALLPASGAFARPRARSAEGPDSCRGQCRARGRHGSRGVRMDAAARGRVNASQLATLPTPLEDAPRLSEALGVRVCVKRDDLTGLAHGGNKARKLRNLCAEALSQQCDVLVTGGGVQSNHVQRTAAAAGRLGLDAHLLLGCEGADDLAAPSGNVLLDELFGATLQPIDADDYESIERAIVDAAEKLRADGLRSYAIPIGGASPPGVAAYAEAAHELRAQRSDIDIVFVADG